MAQMTTTVFNEPGTRRYAPSIWLTWFGKILPLDHAEIRPYGESSPRIAFEDINGALERAVCQEIVGAQKDEVVSSRKLDAFVEGRNWPYIPGVAHDFNPAVLGGKSACHFHAVVC